MKGTLTALKSLKVPLTASEAPGFSAAGRRASRTIGLVLRAEEPTTLATAGLRDHVLTVAGFRDHVLATAGRK